MNKQLTVMKRALLGVTIMVQVMFFPAFALANHDVAHTCPTASGTDKPTGSGSHTFTFNAVSCTWENEHYSWDPVTKVMTPLDSQAYVYNPATGNEERTIWVFSPAANAYTPRVQVKPQPVTPPSPTVAAPSGSTSPTSSSAPTNQNIASAPGTSGGSSIGTTGPDSANNINNNQSTNGNLNLNSGVSVTNGINSTSTSGNASVQGNTNGGNAASGDAETIANILNLLQSSWDPSNGNITTFSADIYDHQGDLLFNPATVLNTGPNSQNAINTNRDNNLDINIQNDGRIVNNVNLDSQSGDAQVSGNTNGGNATTGDANAVANIFNLVNSMISPGSSFIGSINILGNLNGDILLPSLLASIGQTGPDSANAINNNQTNNTNITSVDNRSIANNTNLSAASGNALVSGNTTGGSAQTGNAQTELNIFNLTGRDVIGNNGLLVFTNVLGSWSGFIFDAPTGQSSVLGTGPGSTNTVNNNTANNLNLDSTSNTAIENNVMAASRSGDAAVTNNTNGGNATTGNATASANIVNLINSQLNFSDWFGVLFINVFGSWTGSFGRDTEAGNPAPSASAGSSQQSTNSAAGGGSQLRKVAQVFGFVGGNPPASPAAPSSQKFASQHSQKQQAPGSVGTVKATNNGSQSSADIANTATVAPITDDGFKLSLTTLGIMTGVVLLGLERWLTFRDKRKTTV